MKNWIKSKIGKCKQNIAVKAILLNLVYLLGMLIIFTPFFSIDDYLMSNIVYGAYGTDYDYQITYMSFLYGRLIVFLLRLFPKVPWYTVLFDLWLFIALSLLTYIILNWSDNYAGLLFVNVLLLFISFEGYVAIQFTKVAGIIGAVALLALLLDRLSWKPKLIGAGLLVLSCMIRRDCAKMVMGVWCLMLIWNVIESFQKNRKLWHRANVKRGGFFILGICIFFIISKISSLGMTEEERAFWTLYWKHNDVRSAMQDYSYPEFESNQEVYKTIGISANDLYLYTSWNWDCDVMTLEKGDIIQAMRENDNEKVDALLAEYQLKEKETGRKDTEVKSQWWPLSAVRNIAGLLKRIFDLSTITNYFKIFPKVFLKLDVCIAFFLLLIIASVCWKIKKKVFWQSAIVSVGVLLLLNYYLYMNGRYLQHRVDVGIVLIAITVFLSLLMEEEYPLSDMSGNKMLVSGVLPFLMLSGSYFSHYGDYQVPDYQGILQNKLFFQAAADTEYTYVLGYCRKTGGEIQVIYGALDVPEIGCAQKVIRGNFIWNLLKMDHFYTRLIDNDEMYFVIGDSDENEVSWETYYTEHGEAPAELVLVKQCLGKKVYSVRTKPLKEMVDLSKMKETSEIITEDIEGFVSQNSLTISGSAYLAGDTGFSQKVYIQIENMRTGEYELYDAPAVCDETKEYGDDGYFAEISTTIGLPDFYNRSNRVNLIIEQDGKFYYKKIRQKHLQ